MGGTWYGHRRSADVLPGQPERRSTGPAGTHRLPSQRLQGHFGGDELGLRRIGDCPGRELGTWPINSRYTTGRGENNGGADASSAAEANQEREGGCRVAKRLGRGVSRDTIRPHRGRRSTVLDGLGLGPSSSAPSQVDPIGGACRHLKSPTAAPP